MCNLIDPIRSQSNIYYFIVSWSLELRDYSDFDFTLIMIWMIFYIEMMIIFQSLFIKCSCRLHTITQNQILLQSLILYLRDLAAICSKFGQNSINTDTFSAKQMLRGWVSISSNKPPYVLSQVIIFWIQTCRHLNLKPTSYIIFWQNQCNKKCKKWKNKPSGVPIQYTYNFLTFWVCLLNL